MTSDAAQPPPLPPSRPAAADPLDGFDPAGLVDRSRVSPSAGRLLPLMLVPLGAVLMLSAGSGVAGAVGIAMAVAGLATGAAAGRRLEAQIAAETRRVVALDELIQLRRWPEALHLAGQTLSVPMLGGDRRASALRGLATVLARYHRFEDARLVIESLLAEPIDSSSRHALTVARAMTLLREDLLVDADRAMADIRRDVAMVRDAVRRARGPDAPPEAPGDVVRSAGLALLDLYRDVKTGHFDEAIELFERSHAWLGESLGTRVADAWVLAAAAYDARGRAEDAQVAYANATALTPAIELHRRYPETARLADRYEATRVPE